MKQHTNKLILWSTRTLAVVGIVAIVLVLVGFIRNLTMYTTGSYDGGSYGYDDAVMMAQPMMMDYAMEESFMPGPTERLANEAIAAEIDQKIIKSGTMDMVVDDATQTAEEIESLIQTSEGYVESSSLREHTDGTTSGSINIRIPAESFEQTMDDLKNLAVVVERESVSAEDVTEQYIDVASRLENAKAQEARYVEILDVATTVEEILEIESALGNIRGYIESLTGQLQYFDSVTSYSTIYISLSEEPVIIVAGKEFRPGTTVKEAGLALIAIGQWFIEFIIWLVIVGGGIGLPLALIVWGMIKLIRKRHKK